VKWLARVTNPLAGIGDPNSSSGGSVVDSLVRMS